MTRRANVLLCEADRPTRAGLRMAIVAAGFTVAAEAEDHDTAVLAASDSSPDVALISADLPDGGIDTVDVIARSLPRVKLVVLTSRPRSEELVRAVRAGAAGYLAKDMSSKRLPHALRGVMEGEVALPRRYTHGLLDALRGRDTVRARVGARASSPLTDREWEIVGLLGEGRSTAEIARVLGISQVTVRRHVSSATNKLGAVNRAGIVALLRSSA